MNGQHVTVHAPHPPELRDKPGAWTDLALTLPIFVAYHLGVVFLHVRNGSDIITGALLRLAENNLDRYLLVTCGIGAAFAIFFLVVGRGQAFSFAKFAQVIVEGVVYAIAMRFGAAYLVGRIFAGQMTEPMSPFVGITMSLGAGFYEELAFRAILFGGGARLIIWGVLNEQMHVIAKSTRLSWRAVFLATGWSIFAAAIFSAVHYFGPLGEKFTLMSFAFRFFLGMALTLIFATRGFATAVWTHALYDIWVVLV